MSMRKSRFLLSTAVLLAGVSLAAAQGMREGGGGGMGAGGAAEHDKSGGGTSQGPGGASRGEGMTQGRAAEPRGGRAESPAGGQSRTERGEGMREGGRVTERGQAGKDQQEYLKWTFSDLLVSSFRTGGSASSDVVPLDQISINFTEDEID